MCESNLSSISFGCGTPCLHGSWSSSVRCTRGMPSSRLVRAMALAIGRKLPEFPRWKATLARESTQSDAAASVEFDSIVTRTRTLSWTAQYLDMCAGPVFSLVFLSQSCSVFPSCDISTVTVLIRGSRVLPCCFVVRQFVFAQQKNMCQTISMRCTSI